MRPHAFEGAQLRSRFLNPHPITDNFPARNGHGRAIRERTLACCTGHGAFAFGYRDVLRRQPALYTTPKVPPREDTRPTTSCRPGPRMCLALYGSAELYSISICRNRRGPRRFCGARLCEPQHVGSDRRAGFVKTPGGRQRSCGSQTRAPLVAASPRSAVSRSCTLRGVGKFRWVGPSDALPNTIRRYRRLKICAAAPSPQQTKHIRVP